MTILWNQWMGASLCVMAVNISPASLTSDQSGWPQLELLIYQRTWLRYTVWPQWSGDVSCPRTDLVMQMHLKPPGFSYLGRFCLLSGSNDVISLAGCYFPGLYLNKLTTSSVPRLSSCFHHKTLQGFSTDTFSDDGAKTDHKSIK